MGLIANQMLIETVCKAKQHLLNKKEQRKCAKKESGADRNRKAKS